MNRGKVRVNGASPCHFLLTPRKAAASLFSRLSLSRRFLLAEDAKGDGMHHTREKKAEWEADLAKRDADAETPPPRAGKSTSRADSDNGTAHFVQMMCSPAAAQLPLDAACHLAAAHPHLALMRAEVLVPGEHLVSA
ncbi:hypothetical protein FB451DRAFT_1404922 [Mycena latifolia]|nr:hypothetical protein FB451DRAFT_1404922 [Mycena latifolia]